MAVISRHKDPPGTFFSIFTHRQAMPGNRSWGILNRVCNGTTLKIFSKIFQAVPCFGTAYG